MSSRWHTLRGSRPESGGPRLSPRPFTSAACSGSSRPPGISRKHSRSPSLPVMPSLLTAQAPPLMAAQPQQGSGSGVCLHHSRDSPSPRHRPTCPSLPLPPLPACFPREPQTWQRRPETRARHPAATLRPTRAQTRTMTLTGSWTRSATSEGLVRPQGFLCLRGSGPSCLHSGFCSFRRAAPATVLAWNPVQNLNFKLNADDALIWTVRLSLLLTRSGLGESEAMP